MLITAVSFYENISDPTHSKPRKTRSTCTLDTVLLIGDYHPTVHFFSLIVQIR